MTQPVRLVQITDLHLFGDPGGRFDGVDTAASLEAVIRRLLEQPGPDAFLATGDLVHEDTPSAYLRLRRMLERLPAPVCCIPGNHDDPNLMRLHLPGGNICWQRRLELGGWSVLLLDSRLPHTHAGQLGAPQLAWLERELAAGEGPVLIALHHHPVVIGSPWMDQMKLRDAGEFLTLLQHHPRVRGVVWGHIHQPWEERRHHLLLLGTPSTCIQFTPHSERYVPQDTIPAWRTLTLYPDGSIETAVHRL
ncbi:MAG: phosphoesterase [Gammaproteobacteria bacterium]|nr:MAG: phosphoesterase [Gammaproteobacteria bacterium]